MGFCRGHPGSKPGSDLRGEGGHTSGCPEGRSEGRAHRAVAAPGPEALAALSSTLQPTGLPCSGLSQCSVRTQPSIPLVLTPEALPGHISVHDLRGGCPAGPTQS